MHLRRRHGIAALAGFAVSATSLATAVAAGPSGPSGVALAPVATSHYLGPKGQSLDFRQLKPGAAVHDSLSLTNVGNTATDVSLYAADAIPAVNGGLAFGLRTDKPKAAGLWLRVGLATVHLNPHQSVLVPVSLTLPGQVPGGAYAGGIVAEQVAAPSPSGGGLRQIYRFALPVFFTVPGGVAGATPGRGNPNGTLHLTNVAVHTDKNLACTTVSYRNDSQDILRPGVVLQVKPRWFGSTKTYRVDNAGTILPDASATNAPVRCVRVPVGGADIQVRLGGPRVDRQDASQSVSVDYRPWPFWVALLLLPLLLIALILILWRRRRRRDDEDDPTSDAGGSPSSGSDLPEQREGSTRATPAGPMP